MFETYIVNGRKYKIGAEDQQRFLQMYPSAMLSTQAEDGFNADMSIIQGIKNTLATNFSLQRQKQIKDIQLSAGRAISYFDPNIASWFLGADVEEKGSIGISTLTRVKEFFSINKPTTEMGMTL